MSKRPSSRRCVAFSKHLPAFGALIAAAHTALAANGPSGQPGAAGRPNLHHQAPNVSSVSPLALTPHLASQDAILHLADTKSFGFLRDRRVIHPDKSPAATGLLIHTIHTSAAQSAAHPANSTPDVVLDDTLVTAQSIPFSNGTYTITPNLGRQSGGNLFYSFGAFSLATGETANFTGTTTPAVTNVLVRVTGGQASSIDGTLGCTMSNANFFFMNPAGVVFGAGSSLNLQGSFAVTTASQIKLGSSAVFSATPGAADATLTSDAPSAFTFPANAAGVTIDTATLAVPAGKSLLIGAGSLTMDGGATLSAPGGQVGVVTVASAGDTTFDSQTLLPAPLPQGATGGPISLMNDAAISGDGPGGGLIQIECGNLSLNSGASIHADTLGAGAGQGISINSTGTISVSGCDAAGNDSLIRADVGPDGTGNGGNLTLTAANLSLTGGGYLGTISRDVGNAGNINVTVTGQATFSGADFNVSDSGIYADTVDANAGNITLKAGSLQVLGGAEIVSASYDSGAGGNIVVNVGGSAVICGADKDNSVSYIACNSDFSGAGGSLTLTAGSLQILRGGALTAYASGTGNCGNITVKVAGTATLSGENPNNVVDNSGIFDGSYASGQTGNAGAISVSAKNLQINGGAEIASQNTGSGNCGNVTVIASGQAVFSGSDASAAYDSGVYSTNYYYYPAFNQYGYNPPNQLQLNGSGASGSVMLNAASLQLLNGAEINSSSFGAGKGGNINVKVTGQVLLSGSDSVTRSSGLYGDSLASGISGNAGSITLNAGSLNVLAGAEISSVTYGAGNGGDVTVTVMGMATISGFEPNYEYDDSGIFVSTYSSSAGAGSSGSISLTAASLQMLGGAHIGAETFGPGAGGNINLTIAGEVEFSGTNPYSATAVQNTSYFASGLLTSQYSTGAGGAAGAISMHAGSIQLLAGGEITSSTYGLAPAGSITLNIDGQALFSGTDVASRYLSGLAVNTYGYGAGGGGGNAGSISLNAASLQLLGGAEITSLTQSSGRGGSVIISLQGQAAFSGTDASGMFASGVSVNTTANPYSNVVSGAGGTISLSAGGLQMSDGATLSSSTSAVGRGGDITVNVSGAAALNAASIDAGAKPGSSGDAGNVTFSAASLQMMGGALVTSTTSGSGAGGNVNLTIAGQALLSGTGAAINAQSTAALGGNGGDINLNAGSLQIFDGAQVSSSTSGQGAGGGVNIDVAGQALISGVDTSGNGGVYATSKSLGLGGNAGFISFSAGSLAITESAVVSSTSSGQGAGGSVTVSAPSLSLSHGSITAAAPAAAGGDVVVNATNHLSLGGNSSISASGLIAGRLSITAPTINLAGGSMIATDTVQASPHGSDVSIYTAFLSLDGSVISAQTSGSGNGGNITIGAAAGGPPPSLLLSNSSLISASSSGSGMGGNVTIAAGMLNAVASTVSVSTSGSGAAGGISLKTTDAAILQNGATLSASTTSSGAGGDVTVSAASLTLDGGFIKADTGSSGLSGNISVGIAGAVVVRGGGEISASASMTATGAAGGVTVNAASLTLAGGSISSSNAGSNIGGDVTAAVRGAISIDAGGSVSATAVNALGGDISLVGNSFLMTGPTSQITTLSAQGGAITVDARRGNLLLSNRALISTQTTDKLENGGDISLNASDLLWIDNSTVTAHAAGTGGRISIDPQYVLLNHSTINGLAGGRDVKVTIGQAAIFLQSADSRILSNNLSLPPELDISGALLALPSVAPRIDLTLAPVCGMQLDGDISSFIVTGQGGVAPDPGGLLPSFDIRGPNKDRK